jgi:hypothetical protein
MDANHRQSAGFPESRLSQRQLVWPLLLLALLATGSGCTVDRIANFAAFFQSDAVTVRNHPRNPLANELNLYGYSGTRPTMRTRQVLRRYALEERAWDDPDAALAELQKEIDKEPSSEKVYAYAEIAYVLGFEAEEADDLNKAVDLYGAAVARASMYLFDPRLQFDRNPYDPQFRRATDLYNASLEGVLRIVNDRGELKPGHIQRIRTGGRDYTFMISMKGPWANDEFERFEFASHYEVKGLTNVYHTYGLGVPLIAIRRKQHEQPTSEEKYYPHGLAVPMTAFLRVHPGDEHDDSTHICELELRDPLTTSAVELAGRTTPLESDLSTPFAYFLNDPSVKAQKLATFGLLDGDTTKDFAGIYMMEPYDPRKVPVLMVHGLFSTPITWTEMYNDLRSRPELRDNYQFWFYFYPTGQPFWISAAQLRQDLKELRVSLDPRHEAMALDQMVLIGHSMGGLVSRMQTIESRDDLWQLVSDRPFAELKAEQETREKLAATLFFEPNPSIRRVVTIGTPHRGSRFANDYTQFLGRSLIKLPDVLTGLTNELTLRNPGYFHHTELLTISTSIDSLDPKSPVLPVLLQAPKGSWVKYNNIAGDVPSDSLLAKISESKSDGVVSLASARVEDAESELIVPADHNKVHRHPLSVLEVRRILLEHLDILRREVATNQLPRGPRESVSVGYDAPLGSIYQREEPGIYGPRPN